MNDEALVLFDLLLDYGAKDDARTLIVRSPAERNALWALHAALEKRLAVPFEADYAERLAAARTRLEEQGGGWQSARELRQAFK